jgi:hypothetical protein
MAASVLPELFRNKERAGLVFGSVMAGFLLLIGLMSFFQEIRKPEQTTASMPCISYNSLMRYNIDAIRQKYLGQVTMTPEYKKRWILHSTNLHEEMREEDLSFSERSACLFIRAYANSYDPRFQSETCSAIRQHSPCCCQRPDVLIKPQFN